MSALTRVAAPSGAPDSVERLQSEIAATELRLDDLRATARAVQQRSAALLGRPWVREMANVVAQEYGVDIDEIMGAARSANTVRARHLWVWIIKTTGQFSLGQTARMTCYTDSTTVHYCVRRVEQMRSRDSYFRLISDQMLEIAQAARQRSFAKAKADAMARLGGPSEQADQAETGGETGADTGGGVTL